MLAPQGVADSLLDCVRLGQVAYQPLLTVLMRGVALGNDGEAVAQDQLIDGSSEYGSRYVDEDGLRISG